MNNLMMRAVLVLLGALFISATSAAADSGSTPGNWQAEWDTVLAAAKKEGAVTIAGPPQAAERSVIEKFQKTYPDIKLNYTGLTSGQFTSRVVLEREGGVYEWDVIVGGPTSFFDYLGKGFFQPIRPNLILQEVTDDSKWIGSVEDGFQDNEKKYIYAFTTYVSNQIKVNRSVIPENELNSAEGLLDPKWKGKIVIYDPRGSGAGSSTMSLLRKELGDHAMKVLLVDQNPVLSTEKRQFTTWVIRGQYPIGIGVVDPYMAPFLEQGLGRDVKNLSTKLKLLTPGSGAFVVMNKNPHPNASKVFVNWLLSQETQTRWADTADTNSRRLDVASGSPDTKPDAQKLGEYVNFNKQANYDFKAATEAMAREIRP